MPTVQYSHYCHSGQLLTIFIFKGIFSTVATCYLFRWAGDVGNDMELVEWVSTVFTDKSGDMFVTAELNSFPFTEHQIISQIK